MNFEQVRCEPGNDCESNSQDTSKKEFWELTTKDIFFLDFNKTNKFKKIKNPKIDLTLDV
jgi:hypothetical protein